MVNIYQPVTVLPLAFYTSTLGRKLTNQITVISGEKECGLYNPKYIGKIAYHNF